MVSAGARSQRPLLIEWKTTAGGFENRTKTYVFRRGVYANIIDVNNVMLNPVLQTDK
jgi:hypothetical protein